MDWSARYGWLSIGSMDKSLSSTKYTGELLPAALGALAAAITFFFPAAAAAGDGALILATAAFTYSKTSALAGAPRTWVPTWRWT